MIHSARPIVIASIVFCCFVFLDLKSGDRRTDGRTTCAITMIPTCRDLGFAEWINRMLSRMMLIEVKVIKVNSGISYTLILALKKSNIFFPSSAYYT